VQKLSLWELQAKDLGRSEKSSRKKTKKQRKRKRKRKKGWIVTWNHVLDTFLRDIE
jgi:hypothetical protein